MRSRAGKPKSDMRPLPRPAGRSQPPCRSITMKPNKNARGFWRSIREFAFALAYDERDESEALQPEINFGGNQRWSTRRYQPDSEAEVLDILTRHSGQTIRVLGSR